MTTGLSPNVACEDIAPAVEEADCDVDVLYTFTVDNIGPTTETINTLFRSLNLVT
eukprot:CAMPEP_0113548798 /NCGR_PEP_ID=MMETSP0015_2-20120614/13084_1 /TAXON_ID=2838 /ORGANISM="Odontella" /LENGTH=54 /DNA_ID=CAMNT_0000449449 /DNA_START=1 /DNA_END=161 /DNA_ORIENTATION=+ /assembly_acc=CAM_ASM_000160